MSNHDNLLQKHTILYKKTKKTKTQDNFKIEEITTLKENENLLGGDKKLIIKKLTEKVIEIDNKLITGNIVLDYLVNIERPDTDPNLTTREEFERHFKKLEIINEKKRQINILIEIRNKMVVEMESILCIPNDFLCPISLKIMNDPVVTSSGKVYDRISIQKYFENCRGNGKVITELVDCPLTRKPIMQIVFNADYIKEAIRKFKLEHDFEIFELKDLV